MPSSQFAWSVQATSATRFLEAERITQSAFFTRLRPEIAIGVDVRGPGGNELVTSSPRYKPAHALCETRRGRGPPEAGGVLRRFLYRARHGRSAFLLQRFRESPRR